MLRLMVLMMTVGCMTGCGLKGPLYLPEKSGPVTITPTKSADSQSSESSSSSSSSENKNPL
jgi:predicted small lipoprotein YifL